jgi:hypothetical protein
LTRLIDQPIKASGAVGPFDAPESFHWREREYIVRAVLDVWTDTGAWWDGEGEVVFFRVVGGEGRVFELVRDQRGGWRLYRVYD